MQRLSLKLKTIRKTLGMTATAFAEKLDLQQRTYASYETGQSMPPIIVLSLIVEKFNVNPSFLLTGKGEPFLTESADILEGIMKVKVPKGTKLLIEYEE